MLLQFTLTAQETIYRFNRVKLLDEELNTPIPFATIILQNGRTIETDHNGLLIFPTTETLDTLYLAEPGYTFQYYTVSRTDTIILGRRLRKHLNELTVSAQRQDPLDIVRLVAKNLNKNYVSSDVIQTAFVNQSIFNFGQKVLDVDMVVDLYLTNQKNIPVLNFKQRRVNARDTNYMRQIGPFFMSSYQLRRIDPIKLERVVGSDNYRMYKYALIETSHDSAFGDVWKLTFTPKKTNHKYAFDWYPKAMSGEMIVRKSDFAVVSLMYFIDRDVTKIEKFTRKYSQSKYAAYWRTLPKSQSISLVSRYSKMGEKYHLQYSEYTFYEKGKLVNNDSQTDLLERLSFYSLKEPQIRDLNRDSILLFKSEANVTFDSEFWRSFQLPFKEL